LQSIVVTAWCAVVGLVTRTRSTCAELARSWRANDSDDWGWDLRWIDGALYYDRQDSRREFAI